MIFVHLAIFAVTLYVHYFALPDGVEWRSGISPIVFGPALSFYSFYLVYAVVSWLSKHRDNHI